MNESALGFLVVLGALVAVVIVLALTFGPVIAGALEAWRGLVP